MFLAKQCRRNSLSSDDLDPESLEPATEEINIPRNENSDKTEESIPKPPINTLPQENSMMMKIFNSICSINTLLTSLENVTRC